MNKVKLLPCPVYTDERGYLISKYKKSVGSVDFVENRTSVSKQRVFRGLHTDFKTNKLITLVFGEAVFFCVNLNKKAEDYRHLHCYRLIGGESNTNIALPKSYANGHYCVSDYCVLDYEWDRYYTEHQSTIKLDNSSFYMTEETKNIVNALLESDPIMSGRDKMGKSLDEIEQAISVLGITVE